MKAIIHICQEGSGIYARTRVSMYGCGNNEQQARVREGLTKNGSGMSYTTSQIPQWYCQIMLQHGVKVF